MCWWLLRKLKFFRSLVQYWTNKSNKARIDPPKKNPKFPPSSPMIQVLSQLKYSSLCLIKKPSKEIWSETLSALLKCAHSSNWTEYFFKKQGGGHCFLFVNRISLILNISLPSPVSIFWLNCHWREDSSKNFRQTLISEALFIFHGNWHPLLFE